MTDRSANERWKLLKDDSQEGETLSAVCRHKKKKREMGSEEEMETQETGDEVRESRRMTERGMEMEGRRR